MQIFTYNVELLVSVLKLLLLPPGLVGDGDGRQRVTSVHSKAVRVPHAQTGYHKAVMTLKGGDCTPCAGLMIATLHQTSGHCH